MNVTINTPNLTLVREAASAAPRPETVRQAAPKAPVEADDSQLMAYVSNITRADAAEVLALTKRADTQQSLEATAAAYSEF